MPRTSVAFVVRPWEEVKEYFPKQSMGSEPSAARSEDGSPSVESDTRESWVPAEEFFSELDREDDARKLKSRANSEQVPRIIFPVISVKEGGLVKARSSELPKSPRLLPDRYIIPSSKSDVIAKFLYECYGGGADLTKEAELIESGLLDILNLTPRSRKKVRVTNSPKTRRDGFQRISSSSVDIDSNARYYIDPRDVPEKLTIVAGVLAKAAGSITPEAINILAQIYDISKEQAAGVFDGFHVLDHLHSYAAFLDKVLAEHDSNTAVSLYLIEAMKDHFQIPEELAVELYGQYMEGEFVIVEDPSDHVIVEEPFEAGEESIQTASKYTTQGAKLDPLNPDESLVSVAKYTYDEIELSDLLTDKADKAARYFAAAQLMAKLYEQPLTQMFALVGDVKFAEKHVVYKLTVEELLRAKQYYSISETDAKDPIVTTLMTIFSIDKDVATRLYEMVPSAPTPLESDVQTFKGSELWSFDMLTIPSAGIKEALAIPIIQLHKRFASVASPSSSSFTRLLGAFSLQRVLNMKWLDAYKLTKEAEEVI